MNKLILIALLALVSLSLCKITMKKMKTELGKYSHVELKLLGWRIFELASKDKLILGGLSHNLILNNLSRDRLISSISVFVLDLNIKEESLLDLLSVFNNEVEEVKNLLIELKEYGLRRERLLRFVEEYANNEKYEKIINDKLYNYEAFEGSEDDLKTKTLIYNVIYEIVLNEGVEGRENLRKFIEKAEASRRH